MSDQAVLRLAPAGAAGSAPPGAGVGKAAGVTATGLDALPPEADGRRIWAALGDSGRLAAVYRGGDPASGVLPATLGRLMTDVDARFGIGATLSVCVQISTALPLLALGGDPAGRALRDALAGNAVVALAASDEGSGADLAGLGTTVAVDDDVVTVTGTKRWITGALYADHLLVLARHREGRHFTSFTWVLVPAGAPGVTVEPADTPLFDGSGTGHIRLDEVRLPREHLVGRVGRGMTSFATHIAVERLTGTLWGVALCARTLRRTKEYLQGRAYGDGTLWQLESIRQRFAAVLLTAHELAALVDRLGERVAGRHDTAAAALLKASAARTVTSVLAECAQLQGAEGFAAGGAQWTRAQAALWGIGGGTTEIVLSAVAGSADSLLAELPS
ncbi:acyl-CoA dehydrogenase family protein [Streptomyces sp. NPDC091376]|uniref:acyl-CoA dehydrogenase family protein n=1 Tax=Streptomyces sp. NPDC091376 TaxID=3365994 RepID=UPI003829D0CC